MWILDIMHLWLYIKDSRVLLTCKICLNIFFLEFSTYMQLYLSKAYILGC